MILIVDFPEILKQEIRTLVTNQSERFDLSFSSDTFVIAAYGSCEN